MDDVQRLKQMLGGHYPCILISTAEEALARQTVAQAALDLGLETLLWSVTEGLRNGLWSKDKGMADTQHPAAGLTYFNQVDGPFLAVTLDLIGHLEDARIQRVLRDLLIHFDRTGRTLILIDHQDELPAGIRSYITPFDLSLPNETELEQIIKLTLRRFHETKPLQIELTRNGLSTIIRNLRGLSRRQAEQIIINTVSEDHRLEDDDINGILARKRQMLQSDGLLEYIQTPTALNEIGGLRRLKQWLQQRQHTLGPEAEKFGLTPPRGVLMLGVQGAGKSLCAKAIATAWQRPLLRIDTGALYDRYIGESERRLRATLKQAEMMAPMILWIDEIEKAFASAASRSIDGGLSQRMFGTLLTWMQEHTQAVFLVATANDIEALPPELLRKGRFDEIFFVDLPIAEVRKDIFAIHLCKRQRDPKKFNLDALAEISEGYSGAEIEQAVISALHEAYVRKGDLTQEMILAAVKASPPLSVTMAEHVAALRQWAKGRCVPAD